ncbi:MAG: EscU/YscU/HrcU family type III secretion system export apparatus switch protein [Rhizobacter sp.]|nr:EscU/YscU/HrcU family type III secretion system export apparatus switch protein [Rhizobacter sp.]
MAEKTRDPTPKRLRDARKRGEVVYSHDVSSTLTFVVVTAALWLLGGAVIRLLQELWQHATSPEVLTRPDDRFAELLTHTTEVLLWGVVPLTALVAVAAGVGCFAQVGGLAAWEKLKPDVNRLNPAEGFKRIFSVRNLVNLLKMLAKTVLLGLLMFVVIRAFFDTAMTLGYSAPPAVLQVGGAALLTIFGWAAVIYVVMAGADYAHAHHEFMKQHRMSIEDLRQEHKESEGDPVNASRRRSAHFEAVYLGLGDRVRSASALICSGSTAVALQYLGEKDLPRVVARGENEVAAQMRRFAGEALIPMEFDAPLAGRLYDEVPEGQPIPRSLYEPVARLLRWAEGRE